VKTYVFVGPTLPVADARAELDAIYLPPVAQGDVYRVALEKPRAIGIIDGYFHRIPAVWHKEVLFAMSQGIHVYGASSMGALRAAELAAFGMVGVGTIFERYLDGTYEDDDEVAVAHGPAETGYRSMNEAMANVRATLAKAVAERAIGASTGETLERVAKAMFYVERTWPTVLERAVSALPPSELQGFRSFLSACPGGRVDQKREDALALLRRMRTDIDRESELRPKVVDYQLEYTTFWDELVQSAGTLSPDRDGASSTSDEASITSDAVLDELRLEGDAFLRMRDTALVRALSLRVAQHERHDAQGIPADRLIAAFRKTHGLEQDQELDAWLERAQVSTGDLEEFAREEELVRLVGADSAYSRMFLPRQLRLSGRHADLHARARDKRERLEKVGLWNAQPGQPGVPTRDEVLAWYFARIGPSVPPDLRHHVRLFDFEDADTLVQAALRELCYERLLAKSDADADKESRS
jgi:hypothetical protein